MDQSGSWNVGYGLYVTWPARTVTFARAGLVNGADYDRLTTSESLPSAVWTHLVATYDGTTMRIYFDGVEKASMTSTRNIPSTLSPKEFHIGMFRMDYGLTDYPGAFYGWIDEAAVYNSALTQTQVISHYLGNGYMSEALAQSFRPILRFDSDEWWRPLNVDSFFGETYSDGRPIHHQVCRGLSAPGIDCTLMTSAATLHDYRNGWNASDKLTWPYIDISDNGLLDGYATPDQWCAPGSLLDCDTDAVRTSIYWHVVEPSVIANYRFIDYWFFYRFNDAPLVEFDHEGDWEEVTVAVSPDAANPSTFAFAAFSAHGENWYYLRPTLYCDSGSAPGSCGATQKRVHSFVASGTHANYSQPCPAFCEQTDENGDGFLPENPYDGDAFWGANDTSDALKPFPPELGWDVSVPSPNWVNWWGWWGIYSGDAHVESPAALRTRDAYHHPGAVIFCTERWTDDQVNCPEVGEFPRQVGLTVARRASVCVPWAGPGVAVAVCEPDVLRRALREGTVEAAGPVRVHGDGMVQRTLGAGEGIVQLVGDPLGGSDELHLGRWVEPGALVFVRSAGTKGAVLRVFSIDRRARLSVSGLGSEGEVRLVTDRGEVLRPIGTR
jgi:hypothetical protein